VFGGFESGNGAAHKIALDIRGFRPYIEMVRRNNTKPIHPDLPQFLRGIHNRLAAWGAKKDCFTSFYLSATQTA
jgi:hypothetical protein